MDLMERHNILNLSGMFMYKDIALLDFRIERGCIVYACEIDRQQNKRLYPAEWGFTDKIGYLEINEYYKNHVVEDGAQDIQLYLKAMQMDYYDLDELIKRTNGICRLNGYWLRFSDGVGVQKFSEISDFIPPLIIK